MTLQKMEGLKNEREILRLKEEQLHKTIEDVKKDEYFRGQHGFYPTPKGMDMTVAMSDKVQELKKQKYKLDKDRTDMLDYVNNVSRIGQSSQFYNRNISGKLAGQSILNSTHLPQNSTTLGGMD